MSVAKDQSSWVAAIPGAAGVKVGPYKANTKSEARAELKRLLGIHPGSRLPIDTVVSRVPEKKERVPG